MKALRGLPKLVGGLVGLAMMGTAGAANSAIVIDPGPVGSTFIESNPFTVEADDIGPDNSFHIVFSDMKHLELFAGNDYTVTLFGGVAFTGGFSYTGFLTDENGEEIPNTALDGTVSNESTDSNNLDFDQDLVFHDVHFMFSGGLPEAPFDVQLRVIGFGELAVVGEWTAVPEPGSLALFATGLAVL